MPYSNPDYIWDAALGTTCLLKLLFLVRGIPVKRAHTLGGYIVRSSNSSRDPLLTVHNLNCEKT